MKISVDGGGCCGYGVFNETKTGDKKMAQLKDIDMRGYQGFKGEESPSITVSNGNKLSVKFDILSSGKRVNITRFRGKKACGWMSMVNIDAAQVNLDNLLNNGYTLAA